MNSSLSEQSQGIHISQPEAGQVDTKRAAGRGRTLAILAGNIRRDAFTQRIAAEAARLGPQFDGRLVDISHLPMFSESLDRSVFQPTAWNSFRQQIASARALLLVIPESAVIPSVLKNAFDIASRSRRASVIEGKPAAVIRCWPGAIGGFAPDGSVQEWLARLRMPVLPAEGSYCPNVADCLDGAGRLRDDSTRSALRRFMERLADWSDSCSA